MERPRRYRGADYVVVDLESVNGNVIKDVNSKNLSKIRPISVGDFVVCGPWLGRVDRVVDCVAIVFDDGTDCVVTAVDPEKLIPVSPNILEDPQYPYYPGQRVQVRLSTVSKSTKWLCGNWRENQDEGTVCSFCGRKSGYPGHFSEKKDIVGNRSKRRALRFSKPRPEKDRLFLHRDGPP